MNASHVHSVPGPAIRFFTSLRNLLAAVFSRPARFEREWRTHAVDSPSANSIEGRWQGQWLSTSNGHHGRLRCIMTRSHDGEYRAMFHATYARFLKVSYSVSLRGHTTRNEVDLNGETNLGLLAGGTYHYHGHATPTTLQCDYSCKYDAGHFSLHR